jgi:RNase P/RNase MRP subunit p30
MIDIVIPNNNEEEFITIAEKLGIKELMFLYPYENYIKLKDNINKKKEIEGKNKKIKIHYGILADLKNIQKINNKLKDKKDFVVMKCSNANREVIEKPKANLVFALEEYGWKDYMHQRASGLNQILCRLANKNKVAIGYSISSLLDSKDKSVILGRIIQNIMLCRKFKVKTVIASFTSNPYQMRSPHDLISLFTMLGMHEKEAKDSLENFLS